MPTAQTFSQQDIARADAARRLTILQARTIRQSSPIKRRISLHVVGGIAFPVETR